MNAHDRFTFFLILSYFKGYPSRVLPEDIYQNSALFQILFQIKLLWTIYEMTLQRSPLSWICFLCFIIFILIFFVCRLFHYCLLLLLQQCFLSFFVPLIFLSSLIIDVRTMTSSSLHFSSIRVNARNHIVSFLLTFIISSSLCSMTCPPFLFLNLHLPSPHFHSL